MKKGRIGQTSPEERKVTAIDPVKLYHGLSREQQTKVFPVIYKILSEGQVNQHD